MATMSEFVTDRNEFIVDPESGAVIANPNFGVKTEIIHEVPDPLPQTLSATAFNKYAASKLAGGGVAGMARFMTIMDVGRADTGTAAAFAVAQYDKAMTFDKSEVQAFGALLSAAGHMTAGEVTAIVSDWPEI